MRQWELRYLVLKNISKLTRERPMFLHFDAIGLLYIGSSNESRLEVFSNIADMGGNVSSSLH